MSHYDDEWVVYLDGLDRAVIDDDHAMPQIGDGSNGTDQHVGTIPSRDDKGDLCNGFAANVHARPFRRTVLARRLDGSPCIISVVNAIAVGMVDEVPRLRVDLD